MRRIAMTAAFLGLVACSADDEPEHVHSGDEWTQGMEQAFAEKDDAKMDGTGCSGVRVPDQADFGGRIALTFDDGPNPRTTPRVIETLRAYEAPATFFVKGANTRSDAAQAILAEMAEDESFILGNHSWTHSNLSHMGLDGVASEVDDTNASIEAAGGEPLYFRFPYGASTCDTADVVRDRGMIVTGWHIDSADWCFAANGGVCPERTFRYVPDQYREDMAGYVMAQLARTNGGIVLFHDIHGSTADALPALMERLVEAGYTFTSVDDLETFPLLNGVTPPVRPFVGHACASEADCAFEASGKQGFCHPAGFCSLACEGFCPDKSGEASTFCMADELESLPEGPGGVCVSQASDLNGDCADVPGTVGRDVDRFVGESGARDRVAFACAPESGPDAE